MKQLITSFVVATCLVLSLGTVQAAPEFDREQLRSLNNEHTRIVRQAQRVCSVGPFTGILRRSQNRGCITGEVERHVRSLGDPNMLTFHQSLPVRYRYNSERSFGQVERYFQ